MKSLILLRRHISVGQKTVDSSVHGAGFNYRIEASFMLSGTFERQVAAQELSAALARIDHRALGVDLNLGFEPTTTALCSFLAGILRTASPLLLKFRMVRGDGLTAEWIV